MSFTVFWNRIGLVQFVLPRAGDFIWQRVCYLTLSSLLFGINCVVVITEYWSSKHYHYQWIGRQNEKLEIHCITEWLNRMLIVCWRKCIAGHFFWLNPDGYSVLMILLAFITGNSSLEPLLEGLCAQIHIDLSWRVFGRNLTGDLQITQIC